MRIQLYLTPPDDEPLSTSIPSTSTSIPKPLTALTPSGELILIELQGSLEMDNDNHEGGQVVGEFQWGDGREDKPTLLLSHHKLEGKLVNLTKPLAVLRKRVRRGVEQPQDEEEEDEGDETIRPPTHDEDAMPPSSPAAATTPPPLAMSALADSDYDDEEAGDVSPSIRARRKRGVGGQSTPSKKARVALSSPPLQSSPLAPMRGSAIDFSSPPRDMEASRPTRTTQVSYDVVCVIRKKVLFSKRPEPVVHRRV